MSSMIWMKTMFALFLTMIDIAVSPTEFVPGHLRKVSTRSEVIAT